jgi:multidrug efflux pump subunit AcrA (membrane-fusion protein)
MKLTSLLPTEPRKRQLAITGAIIGTAILASASIFATGPSAKPADRMEKAWPVSVTTAQPQTLQPSFSAFGKLESNRVAQLRSDVSAQVRTVNVNEGNWVETGELLVQLDDRDAQLKVLERAADLKQATANLTSMRTRLTLEKQSTEHFERRHKVAQAKLARHEELLGRRLIAQGLLDEVMSQASTASIEYRDHVRELANLPNEIAAAEAQVARAEALLEQAQLELERTAIVAPFAGPVLAVHASPGDYSSLSTLLVEVADAAGFEVRIQVPDTYNTIFQQAMDKLVSINAYIQASTESVGTLNLVRLTSHVRTGQTGLDAFFAYAPPPVIAPSLGRVYNLRIELPAQEQVIAVPVQAIYENRRIYTVVENRLVSHQIERVGEMETAEHGYQILVRTREVHKGDTIVTTQLPRAITGLLVEVANREA